MANGLSKYGLNYKVVLLLSMVHGTVGGWYENLLGVFTVTIYRMSHCRVFAHN